MLEEDIRKKSWLKKASKFFVVAVFLFLGWQFFENQASAVNTQINYQGKLTNASGVTVADGNYDLKIVIYDASSGGTCQYSLKGTCGTPTAASTTVVGGIFSVNLGDTSAGFNALSSSIFTSPSLYLGVTVNTDSEMTPRKHLTAAPYAFDSERLSGLSTSTSGGNSSYIPATDSSGNLRISGAVFVATTTAAQFGVGTSSVPSGIKNYTESTTASDKILVIRGSSSQSGHLFDLQNSAGASLAFINSGGSIFTSSTLQATGNFTAYSLTSLLGGFISNASSSVGAGLQVAGALSASGTLGVAGAASLSSTLGVSSLSTLTGGFISNTSSSVGAGLQVAGNLSASSLSVANLATLASGFISAASSSITAGGLRVGGNLSASSTLTLAGGFFQSVFTDCSTESQTVLWNATTGQFSCGTDAVGSGTSVGGGWTTDNIGVVSLVTSTDSVGIGASAPLAKVHIRSMNAATTTLIVEGAASQTADLFQARNSSGNVLFSVDSSANLSTSGTFRSVGLTTLTAGFIANASSSITNGLQVAGAFNASGTLQAAGAATLASTLSVTGLATQLGGFISNSSSSVLSLQVAQALNASSTLLVGGAATLNSTLSVSGLSTLTGGFISNASSSVGAGLQVAGALSASGTLGVTSLSTLAGGFISNASSSIGSNLNVTGNLNASSTIFVGGNILPNSNNTRDLGAFGTAFGNLFASGTSRLGVVEIGNVTFGTSTTNLITVNARFASSLLPNTNNANALGAFGNAWSDIFASGTAKLDILETGNITVGTSTTNNITVTGRIASNIVPGSNNSRDLGAFGNAFANFYASGTSRLAALELGTATNGSTSTAVLIATGTVQLQSNVNNKWFVLSSSTLSIDWHNGNNQQALLSSGCPCTITMVNPRDGAKYLLKFKQDATGSRTVTWPSTVTFSGFTTTTLTTTANRSDYVGLVYDLSTNTYAAIGETLNFAQ